MLALVASDVDAAVAAGHMRMVNSRSNSHSGQSMSSVSDLRSQAIPFRPAPGTTKRPEFSCQLNMASASLHQKGASGAIPQDAKFRPREENSKWCTSMTPRF